MRYRRSLPLRFAACTALSLPAAAQQCDLAWISQPLQGASSAGASRDPDFSDDGRFLVFWSEQNDLVLADLNPGSDIFLHDRSSGTLSIVSVATSGAAAQASCFQPSISGDGTCVAFWSLDTSMHPGNPAGVPAVFVRDLVSGFTRRASVSSAGIPADQGAFSPDLSGDGRFVAFHSAAHNLVPGEVGRGWDVFVHDRTTGATRCATADALGRPTNTSGGAARLARDGSKILLISLDTPYLPSDTNGLRDAYLRDLQTGAVQLVSSAPGGAPANGTCHSAVLSADGATVVFDSSASNLVPGDANSVADVFARDVATGAIMRLSVGPQGQETAYHSAAPAVSGDGRYVVFESQATGWFPGASVGTTQVCVRDRLLGTIALVSATALGQPSSGACGSGAISGDGSRIAFHATGPVLLPPQAGSQWNQVLVRDCAVASVPQTYCTAKLNSAGCLPQIGWQGASSASLASGFQIRCASARNQKVGLLLHGFGGRAAAPFQGGTLCLAAPVHRGPAQSSGGSPLPANDCSGIYALDMNAHAASLPPGSSAAALAIPGTQVQAQWWGRDPGFPAPNATQLSAGLEYVVGL